MKASHGGKSRLLEDHIVRLSYLNLQSIKHPRRVSPTRTLLPKFLERAGELKPEGRVLTSPAEPITECPRFVIVPLHGHHLDYSLVRILLVRKADQSGE